MRSQFVPTTLLVFLMWLLRGLIQVCECKRRHDSTEGLHWQLQEARLARTNFKRAKEHGSDALFLRS